MNIESKVWNFSGTGTKVHAFIDGKVAACRKSIARPAGSDMDYCEAKQGFKSSICTTCDTKFNAAIERAENAMQPSTGEACCDHAPMYHGGRGCDLCNCTNPRTPKPVEGTFHTYLKITPEVIRALAMLRNNASNWNSLRQAADILDNAGIFAPIDETTGYDIDPVERISKCTCHPAPDARSSHHYGCPGDPAEYGDMAFKVVGQDDMRDVAARIRKQPYQPERVGNHERSSAPSKDRRPCPADQCTLDFAVNKDGTLHQHLNDNLEPCPGVAPYVSKVPGWADAVASVRKTYQALGIIPTEKEN